MTITFVFFGKNVRNSNKKYLAATNYYGKLKFTLVYDKHTRLFLKSKVAGFTTQLTELC